jgi:hypothetical protein
MPDAPVIALPEAAHPKEPHSDEERRRGRMHLGDRTRRIAAIGVCAVISAVFVIAAWAWIADREAMPRAQALGSALRPLLDRTGSEAAIVARAILDNYEETRGNAARWSGVYWGFTFLAAVMSGLSALVLKLETLIANEAAKKDLAAALSVAAALLVTIATSGDFQRKWQANREAAADLERAGYQLLASDASEPPRWLGRIGEILHRRHLAIVGSGDDTSRAAAGDTVAPVN